MFKGLEYTVLGHVVWVLLTNANTRALGLDQAHLRQPQRQTFCFRIQGREYRHLEL